METRASYALVGAFILVLMLAMVGFVIWLAKFNSDVRFDSYQIYFPGSVTGLDEDSTVRYRGIPVGTVRELEIDPADPELIRVEIEIDANTPVKTDTVASIELQGITGVAYVQLAGGSRSAPALEPRDDDRLPTITATSSALQEVFKSAPELLRGATELINRGTELLSDDNRAALSATLANLRDLTGSLAENKDSLAVMIEDARLTMANVRQASDDVRGITGELRTDLARTIDSADQALVQFRDTLASVDRTVTSSEPDIRELVANLKETTASLRQAADTANAMLAENRDPLNDFAQTGLYEFGQFIIDARALVASLTQIAAQIERDPASFFLGGNQAGYQAQ